MATIAELESRILALEAKVSNAITLPIGAVAINDAKITNKTGWIVYGETAGINGGLLFVGVSLVPSPTLDIHIEQPFIFKAF